VRVTPDRQTLILAGEMPPRRGVAGTSFDDFESQGRASSQSVTIISARVDASMIVTQRNYTPNSSVIAYDSLAVAGSEVRSELAAVSATPALSGPPAPTSRAQLAYASPTRGPSYNGASAYARTRDLSDRLPIIDTYA
jgi:hypothetical protein